MEPSNPNPIPGIHRTLDLSEAADFLKVSEATAQEMAATGELPGAKIGRAWVFLLDDLADWLRQQVRAQREERRAKRPVASERSPETPGGCTAGAGGPHRLLYPELPGEIRAGRGRRKNQVFSNSSRGEDPGVSHVSSSMPEVWAWRARAVCGSRLNGL